MHANSSQSRLEVIMQKKPPGDLVFPGDYLDIGTPEAIHMAFSRMAKENKLKRLGKGIYLKPKIDPLLGELLPSLEQIALQIARKEKVIIRPTGAYALNKLGLSTQVPTKVVFLTNGNSRTIRVGRGVITFKKTTPKKLAAKNEVIFLAIQALIELGEKGTTSSVIHLLTGILQREGAAAIREDASAAPQYVARTMFQIAENL